MKHERSGSHHGREPHTTGTSSERDSNMEEPHLPQIREVMASDPVVVPPDTTIQEAAVLMGKQNIGCVVVGDEDTVKGIFTERDLLRRISAGYGWQEERVEEAMTRDPVSLGLDETLDRAVQLLGQTQVRHLPVLEKGRLMGVLSVPDMIRHRAQYLEWVVRQQTAQLQATNAALQERDRVMQHHLEMAARVQQQMLPPPRFDSPPLSLAVEYHPLDRVSGDYYDFAILTPDRLGILIADASGHSVPAAMVSAVAKTVFYAYGRTIQSPAAVLRTMNDHLTSLLEAERFVTMFYGVVDRASLQLAYAGAGHPPPLWHRRRIGTVETLDSPGIMLGVLPAPAFDEHVVQLDRGDAVLFYTDGLTECQNQDGEMFGLKRAATFLESQPEMASASLAQAVDRELGRFRASLEPADDLTLIVLGIEPP